MQPNHTLKSKAKMSDIRARFSVPVTQVSTTVPHSSIFALNTTSHNPFTGNRTLILSPSPPPTPTSTESYRPWTGTTEIAGPLRTLGGFPWHIPGDHGEGYESPVTPSDSESVAGILDPEWRMPQRSRPPPSCSVSVVINPKRLTFMPDETCACCGLRHAFFRLCSTIKKTLFYTHASPTPVTPLLPNPHLPLDADLLQIHLRTVGTTFPAFMAWFFSSFDICRHGERVHFPEQHYLHLPARAVALLVAMDLEEALLCVEGDGEDSEVAWSLAVELRRLI